jgi:superfamily II DNA or RNA helicase
LTTIYDNIVESLGEQLIKTFQASERIDAAVGYFNLRGWRDLSEELDTRDPNADGSPVARVIVGMTGPSSHEAVLEDLQREVAGENKDISLDGPEAKKRRKEAMERFKEQLMRGLPDAARKKALLRMRRHLNDGVLRVRLFTRRPMHGKTYICHREDVATPIIGYVGSSNLTLPGLKYQYELNVDVIDGDAATKLAKWFQDRWDDEFCLDITQELIDLLDESWAAEKPADPYLIYLKVCYLLSQEARDGLLQFDLPQDIHNQLLDFQAAAVKTLAHRVYHRGGAMLGDVVGLGKTISAIAVAAILREEYGFRPLVVCPKNLVLMWEEYLRTYDLHGQVIPFSMAKKNLPKTRRYQFVIVDESHTLRNHDTQAYEAVAEYLEENSSKVLLLTATPYNKRYRDVKNQLALFIDEDENLGITPSAAISLDPGIVDRLDGKVSTLAAFALSEEAEDWRRLMSEHLVRRTRSFIRQNYAEVDPDNGREFLTFADGTRFYFPEREARPLPHSFGNHDPARLMVESETLDAINNLALPRYSVARYVSDDAQPTPPEQEVIDNLDKSGGNLVGFTRIGLYKRLSSCGHAFVMSLQRHADRNRMWVYALDNGLAVPIGSVLDAMLDSDDPDAEDVPAGDHEASAKTRYETLVEKDPKSIKWLSADLFDDSLREDLVADAEVIQTLLDRFGVVDHTTDSKIDALVELLTTTHADEKVVIFSEYKDTTDYVALALKKRKVSKVVSVSGDSSNPTALAARFSPKSNSKLLGEAEIAPEDEIRVLVSTDVLSEGQNLQDAHIVINYDLPWAIIRLIQRAGRVDRIGQESEEVLIYSFLPEGNVDKVLDLRERIRRRLTEAAQVFGSDEDFFGTPEEVSTIEGLYTGNLADVEGAEGEVDAASYAFQVWQKAESETPELAEKARHLPDLVSAAKKQASPEQETGVMTYVRTKRGFDGFGMAADDGQERLLTALEALRLLACSPDTKGEPLVADHFERVKSLAQGKLAKPQLVAGRLGRIRERIHKRLVNSLLAADPDVERALDALFESPLTSDAEDALRKALRNQDNENLAALVAFRYREGTLVVPLDGNNDPLRVVCSMGVLKQ